MLEFSHKSFIFIQAIGFVSMAIGWWANAQKNDKSLLTGNLMAACLTATHLGLLGSMLGMANQLLNMGRFGLSRVCNKNAATKQLADSSCSPKRSQYLLSTIFALAAVIQGVMLAHHWSEWCAVIAAIIMSIALFNATGSRLRWAMVASNLLNLTLSIHLMSYSGILYQVITVALLLNSLCRLSIARFETA